MDMQVMKLEDSNNCIDIEKHFKITAGPGAGKTRWLINHIKNVLNNSKRLLRNKKICCITYTNVGVETIKRRLNEADENIEVSTIHAFLFKHIVKPYFFVISDKYNVNYLKMDGAFDHTPSNGWFMQTQLIRRNIKLNEMKKVYWRLKEGKCSLHIRNRRADFHSDLLKYKENFWKKGLIHHDDILGFSWEILNSNENVLRIIRAKFPYFFIDEFQDTSPLQAEIIKMIGKKETIVGVIGDQAQSIYKFQGADVEHFNDFTLNGMQLYKISNNHRSTKEILNILNNTRKDIRQKSPKNKKGTIPIIFVGDKIKALLEVEKLIPNKDIASLCYANFTSNKMKRKNLIDVNEKKNLFNEIMENDTNSYRRKFVLSCIKSLEYARENYIKDSINELKKYFTLDSEIESRRETLKVIKKLLNKYSEIEDFSLFDFYQLLYKEQFCEISKLTDRSKIGKISKDINYKNIALWMTFEDEASNHRTIHKAKGDEFENVLMVVEPPSNRNYNEQLDLNFLLNPDLENNEDHRVYYVGMSRAKSRLYINLPDLSDENESKLKKIGFEIKRL